MRYEIKAYWSTCDKEYHYILYIDGHWFAQFCSLEVILEKLRQYLRRKQI